MLAARRGFPQGVTFPFDHTVAVKDLAEEEKERASLSHPVTMPFPAFPPELLRAGVSGEASIRFQVHADGNVSDVIVMAASHDDFGGAARVAADGWRFSSSVDRTSGKATKNRARCRLVFRVD